MAIQAVSCQVIAPFKALQKLPVATIPYDGSLRKKMSLEGPTTSWAVRRCHVCGASNVQALDHFGEQEDI